MGEWYVHGTIKWPFSIANDLGASYSQLELLSNRDSKHKVITDRVGLNQQDERNLRRQESVIGEGVIIFLSLNFSLKIGF